MTIPRMLLLLAGLSGVGIAVVAIRVEESRTLRRIQELQFAETAARQEIRAQEAKLWTLRAPPNIRERAEQLRPAVESPPKKPGGSTQGGSRKR